MRTIRFRGICCHCDKWAYGNLVDYGEDELPEIQGFDVFHEGIDEWKDVTVERDTVGQFTGLYDKNGKEIYEGDIIKIPTKYGDEVFWIGYESSHIGAFCLCDTDDCNSRFVSVFGRNFDYEPFYCEVIGNIHDKNKPNDMGREKITITKRKAKGVLADMIANMDEDSLAKTREKMERITEDYCSQEVRNLLVTKGFMGDMWYDNDDIHISHALAMKWLREVKDIYINVRNTVIEPLYDGEHHFVVDILDRGKGEWVGNDILGNSYEEAVEAALKYALENLI